MTNEEKFKEIFGLEPDTGTCPLDCSIVDAPFCNLNGPCTHREGFWEAEYKERSDDKPKITIDDAIVAISNTNLNMVIASRSYLSKTKSEIEEIINCFLKAQIKELEKLGTK